jgi:hypothetical protein
MGTGLVLAFNGALGRQHRALQRAVPMSYCCLPCWQAQRSGYVSGAR